MICKFNIFKDDLQIIDEKITIGVDYAKDEIEIRVESLKIELDELKVKMINDLNDYKNEFQEYVIISFS